MLTGIVLGIALTLACQRLGPWLARRRRLDPWLRAVDQIDGPLL